MPWILGAATVLGGAASLVSGNNAVKAAERESEKTRQASQYATDQSIALAREQYYQGRADNLPYLQTGYGALSQLGRQYGIQAPAVTNTVNSWNPLTNPTASGEPTVNSSYTTGAYTPGGTPPSAVQPDWAAYIAADPGIVQEFNRMSPGWKQANNINSIDDFAKRHWETVGRTEAGRLDPYAAGRAAIAAQSTLPTQPTAPVETPAPTVATTTPSPTVSPSAAIDPTSGSLSNILTQVIAAAPKADEMARPAYTARPLPAPRPVVARPEAPARPVLVRPEMEALDLGLDKYQKSPGYEFQLEEGNNNILTNAAATGLRKSGAAQLALLRYGQDYANTDYYGWADRERGQWNTDRGRLDANYAFDANRSDQNYNFDVNRLDDNYAFDATRSDNNYAFDTSLANQNFNFDATRADNNFNIDRAFKTDRYLQDRDYATGVYNTNTANLFTLAGMGQGAVGTNVAAGQNYAGNVGNAYFSNAAAQGAANANSGNAAIAGANMLNGVISNGLTAAAYYYGRRGNGSTTTPKAA